MKPFADDTTISAKSIDGSGRHTQWVLPAEVPIGLIYRHKNDRHDHAVMMATPSDLEDFGLGFSLAEGILHQPAELGHIDIKPKKLGIELHIYIPKNRMEKLLMHKQRRSHRGRAGCGICGVDSLGDALRPLPRLPFDNKKTKAAAIHKAIAALPEQQPMRKANRTVHGAGWATPDGDITVVREDIGRHNALDKMIGARAKSGETECGFALLSSRCTYELVQKCALAGIRQLVCLAAPTLNAVETARRANISLYIFERKTVEILQFTASEVV